VQVLRLGSAQVLIDGPVVLEMLSILSGYGSSEARTILAEAATRYHPVTVRRSAPAVVRVRGHTSHVGDYTG